MVDNNLFLHDLSVVAVIKNEAHYLKEWLDYHLAAGVDHFYFYGSESSDDTREVLKPYIENRIVDLFPMSGEGMQIPAYNDAVRKFKFTTRYMAFIDVSEFIFPKTSQSINEVVDEVLSKEQNAAGLAINWQVFGSNNLETADYSKGVLERFTRRAPSNWFEPPTQDTLPVGNIHVKTIANPRYIRYIVNPHYAYYFDGKFAVNADGERVLHWGNEPILSDKIVVNKYFTKSKEEFQGRSDDLTAFDKNDRNDEADYGILSYRKLRAENYTPPKGFEREDYFKRLEGILLPASRSDVPQEYFEGKLETFLTCRALASILRRSFPKDNRGALMEESALRAINNAHFTKTSLPEVMMMLHSLTPILVLPYPVVDEIRKNCMNFVRQIMGGLQKNSRWEAFIDMGNYFDLLAAIGAIKAMQNAMHNS